MIYALALAVIVILLLVVDRVRQEAKFIALVESAFKQGDNAVATQERLVKLQATERERMDREAQRERSLILARETNATMVDGAAVAASMVERYGEMGGAPKAHISPDDDEGWANLLQEQREALEQR